MTTPDIGRGTEDELAGLHGLLTQYFKARLSSGDPLPPSELNAVRQFLKDNYIDCIGSKNMDLQDIAQALPDFNKPETFADDGLSEFMEGRVNPNNIM